MVKYKEYEEEWKVIALGELENIYSDLDDKFVPVERAYLTIYIFKDKDKNWIKFPDMMGLYSKRQVDKMIEFLRKAKKYLKDE